VNWITQQRGIDKDKNLIHHFFRLYDANLVGDVQSIVVRGKTNVRLLLSIRPDEGIDLGDLDVVELLDCHLDLRLVGALVYDEDEGVVVLDLLHRGLRRQRVLDDLELIQPRSLGGASARVFGRAGQMEGLGSAEVHGGAHLANALVMHALQHGLLGSQRLLLRLASFFWLHILGLDWLGGSRLSGLLGFGGFLWLRSFLRLGSFLRLWSFLGLRRLLGFRSLGGFGLRWLFGLRRSSS